MKKLCLLAGLAVALCAATAQAVYDGRITITGNPYEYNPGGEFTATPVLINGGSIPSSSFQTFCLETSEYLGLGDTYDFRVNTGAVLGDGGAHNTDPNTGLAMDNISIGTAWLYAQFCAGTLANYDFANTLGKRYDNAGDLQKAIWWLEGENLGVKNGFVTTAEAVLGLVDSSIISNALGSSQGTYGVGVLNLYNGYGSTPVTTIGGPTYNLNQDVLVYGATTHITPVPEASMFTAASVGLLGLIYFGRSLMLRRRTA